MNDFLHDPCAAMTARDLEQHYTSFGEHPELPRADWRDAVERRTTLAGYWDWVAAVVNRRLIADWDDDDDKRKRHAKPGAPS